ncbi:MAG: DHH family phosphoesterase [Acutalibacteraceae bacterium]
MKIKAMFYQNPSGYLAALLLLAFSGISYALDNKTAYLFLIACALVLFINILYSVLSFTNTKKYVSEVSKSLGDGSNAVESFPLPCAMCDMRGNVVWFNSKFTEEVVGDSKNRINMSDFFTDFNYSKYASKNFANAVFENKKYSVFITKVRSKSNPMLCFYFYDDTYLKETEAQYKSSRPFVAYLLVDNIEQLARKLTDSKFAQVLSGIESRIEDWIKDEKVILKKISNGCFLIIGRKKELDKLSEKKFSVLNSVREYKYKDASVDATVSIGVGCGDDFASCESRAKKSLDMALGRGGDQVAIYTDDGYVYYGGISNKSNDNSKVSPRKTAANISTLIKKFEKVFIVGHKYSDYDAIGSAMGISFLSEVNGVPASVVVDKNSTLSNSLITLAESEGFDNFIGIEEAIGKCNKDTLLVIVDTHRKILMECPQLIDSAGGCVVIDHHRRSEDYISDADILYHLPSASSTCEMVSELIQYSTTDDDLPSIIATALLSGIVLDTKEFVLKTYQRTFEAAAFLREHNADTVAVRKLFSVSSDMISLKNEIINNGVIFKNCVVAATESNNRNIRIITSKAADEMLNIEGIKASFVLYYIGKNTVQVSARSLGEENVQIIMEMLGGGGHSTMAAAQLKDTDLSAAKDEVIKAIDKYLQNK